MYRTSVSDGVGKKEVATTVVIECLRNDEASGGVKSNFVLEYFNVFAAMKAMCIKYVIYDVCVNATLE